MYHDKTDTIKINEGRGLNIPIKSITSVHLGEITASSKLSSLICVSEYTTEYYRNENREVKLMRMVYQEGDMPLAARRRSMSCLSW